MTDQTPSKSALYQRQRILKAKEQKEKQKDIIEKQQIAQAKKISQVKKQQKNNAWDFEGLEPTNKLRPQYPDNKEDEYAFNLWGSASDTQPTVNPLSKISHAQNLKALFGNRAE